MSKRKIILVDGPSGSGKTTFANQLGRDTSITVVHLDDFYPGWSGLAEGVRMVVDDVLHPTQPGFTRWDWEKNQPGQWVQLDPEADVIIEGVGALTQASYQAASQLGDVFTVRITAPYDARKRRALERDPDYAEYWDMWAEQERELRLKELPVTADLVLQGQRS
ncbi:hypothetical protein [Corynebacterium cystitidis]|uniref:hypothetical protein n=1 Tax=Corynebacterium cystitidis TaxID=35757 RepID=UPI00211F1654|nr:hypothetical protein [Corynebacterium cystitidis]